jgi:hypothetical protein
LLDLPTLHSSNSSAALRREERRIGGFGCLARLPVDHLEIRGNGTAEDAFCINTLRSEFTLKNHAQKVTRIIQQEIIDIVFKELKRIGQCSSRRQFSREWFGREESYYRSIQSKGLKPSAEAQLNLVAKLRSLGTSFSRSEYPSLVKIGNTYLKLYGECLDALLNSAQSDAVKLDCGEVELIQ